MKLAPNLYFIPRNIVSKNQINPTNNVKNIKQKPSFMGNLAPKKSKKGDKSCINCRTKKSMRYNQLAIIPKQHPKTEENPSKDE